MKSQEFNTTINSSKLLTQSSLLESKSQEKPLCPGKYQATHLCLNPKCKASTKVKQKIPPGENQENSKQINNPFICSNDKCQFCCTPDKHQWTQIKKQTKSGKAHQNCFMTGYKRLLFCIKQKKKNCQPLKDSINKIFDEFIDYLSDLRQKYLDELKYHGLSSDQQKFLSCFDKKEFEQITPELGLRIVTQLSNQLKNNALQAKKKLNKFWEEQKVKAKDIFELIERKISKDLLGVSIDSKIVTFEEEQLNLIKMLQDQQKTTVKSLPLLYRASQNDFDALKFHQQCDLIQHTVVVIETEQGKKIGGYTPLVWDRRIKNKWSSDSSGKSFVFSLTNNQKFTLIKSQEQKPAIVHRPENGPIFGNDQDIFIVDKGNKKNCWARIGSSYAHPEYQYDQSSWTKFSGAIGTNEFKVKEWEVFQVQWS